MTARAAAQSLTAILDEESGALERVDYGAAMALFARKKTALAELDGAGSAGLDEPTIEALAHAAERNRRALLRALRVQGRVLDIVATALRRRAAVPFYGPRAPQPATALLRARA